MEHNSPNEYRTGGSVHTNWPGSLFTAGILVFLAIAGMFLAISFLILRTDLLSTEKELASLQPVEGSRFPENEPHMEGEVTVCAAVGITCQSISEFCENFYDLPAGIYVLQVENNSPAARQGVLPGDVLVRVDGIAVRLPATLENMLENSAPHTILELEFFRKNRTYTVYVTSGA